MWASSRISEKRHPSSTATGLLRHQLRRQRLRSAGRRQSISSQNEPISGQGNIAEATVFRGPTVYTGAGTGAVLGLSQESNVGAQQPSRRPVRNLRRRWRRTLSRHRIQRGNQSRAKLCRQIRWLRRHRLRRLQLRQLQSRSPTTPLTVTSSWTVSTRIFASYGLQNLLARLRSRSARSAGTLPAAANLPASCAGAFPCPKAKSGRVASPSPTSATALTSAWSVLRLVSSGTAPDRATALVSKVAQDMLSLGSRFRSLSKTAVTGIPLIQACCILRSHYQQYDGARQPSLARLPSTAGDH